MRKLFPLLLIVLFMGCGGPFFSAKTVDEVCNYARQACDIWDTLWVYDTTEVSVYYADCMPSGAPYVVYFNENSAEMPDMNNILDLPAEKVLYEALTIMEQCETADMMITGHCDDRLSEEYNDSLGFERAKAVMGWFKDRGVNGFRIMIYSEGEDNQVAKAYYDEMPKYWRLRFNTEDGVDSMKAVWIKKTDDLILPTDSIKAGFLLDRYDYSGDQMRQEIWRLNRRAEIKILK